MSGKLITSAYGGVSEHLRLFVLNMNAQVCDLDTQAELFFFFPAMLIGNAQK